MFEVEIKNLKTKARIGISSKERKKFQKLLVTLRFKYSIRTSKKLDNIKKDISSKISIECSLDIKEVLKIIKENYPSGKLVICGSLYLAGEVLKQDGFKIN